ncbi:hypothetical protein JMM81_19900 [Bacillus sp. V3B]|uniref:hypothetical protein n=1 Tax=Bacillus sp. V3B TaxID=2804915 RepID=UPI00210B5836|nr:hypothetical protein [Bacillus sp. V3B]MCQ6277142.1 hypothetical protein [Bacillus sp. V3B]
MTRIYCPFNHCLRYGSIMDRKMINTKQIPSMTSPKRTTIYLPREITLLKPTNEINNQLTYLPKLHKISITDREMYLDHYKTYFLPLRELENTKPYQITIEQKRWCSLNRIKRVTGLTNSQIVTLCFVLGN